MDKKLSILETLNLWYSFYESHYPKHQKNQNLLSDWSSIIINIKAKIRELIEEDNYHCFLLYTGEILQGIALCRLNERSDGSASYNLSWLLTATAGFIGSKAGLFYKQLMFKCVNLFYGAYELSDFEGFLEKFGNNNVSRSP